MIISQRDHASEYWDHRETSRIISPRDHTSEYWDLRETGRIIRQKDHSLEFRDHIKGDSRMFRQRDHSSGWGHCLRLCGHVRVMFESVGLLCVVEVVLCERGHYGEIGVLCEWGGGRELCEGGEGGCV